MASSRARATRALTWGRSEAALNANAATDSGHDWNAAGDDRRSRKLGGGLALHRLPRQHDRQRQRHPLRHRLRPRHRRRRPQRRRRGERVRHRAAQPDTDGDGLSDGDEVDTCTTPSLSSPTADGDGFTDGNEVIVGADPNDPNSTLVGFDLLATLNTNAATDSGGEDWFPQVASDGAGNWVAVWYSGDSLGGTIGTDNDILVARSSDDGRNLDRSSGAGHQRRDRFGRRRRPTGDDRRGRELGGGLVLLRLAGQYDRHRPRHPRLSLE